MRDKSIQNIVTKADELGTISGNLLNTLGQLQNAEGQPFDLRKPITGRDSSTAQIVARIDIAVGLIAEYNKARRADLVPLKVLSDLEAAMSQTIAAVNGIMTLVSLLNNQGGIRSFNYSNFQFQTNNGNSHNAQTAFHELFDASESFLQRFFESLYILKPRASFSFQAAATSLSNVISDANEALASAKSSQKKVSDAESQLTAKDEAATTHLKEIERLKTEGAADRQAIAKSLAEVTQHKTNVEAVNAEASSLKTNVDAYEEAFELFQKKLDQREVTFAEGTRKLNGLIEKFEKRRSEVEGLIERSEQMLSSATVAGLAANFSNMMEALTKELRWARRGFYIGILFLAISALPLLAFIGLPLIPLFYKGLTPDVAATIMRYGPGTEQNSWQYLGHVVGRLVVLLPAAWLVSFASIRHASLFRLREHYAYKYSMAVAVEGFKQQAPEYNQEIAALVLEQLAFNPADKLIPSKYVKEGRAPGLAGFLLDKIRSRVDHASTGE